MSAEEALAFLVIALVAIALNAAAPRSRRGCGINDLSRWEQFGGTLKRPPPPGRSR